MTTLDPFSNAPPVTLPLDSLPATAPVKIAVTWNVPSPNAADETTAGALVQGVVLSAGDVVLLLGQTDPTENGFWSVLPGGGIRLATEAQFVRDGAYYQQFQVPVSAGMHAGAIYFLETPTPADVADAAVTFVELTPQVVAPSDCFDKAGPGA